jgi:acyl-coenzyme A synthetase/AMP-(fatty) acid ligase
MCFGDGTEIKEDDKMFCDIEKKESGRLCALADDGGRLTYGDLVVFTETIKDVIPTRSLVFSLCRNTIGSLAGYVGFLEAKMVPLLLNSELDDELLQYLLQMYKPNYIWMPEEKSKDFDGKIELKKYGYVLVQYDDEQKQMHSDLALLLTTSGSTGSPKLVRQSYVNIESNAKAIVEYLELDDTERPITMLPMHYTYGLSVINSHLLAGATILMTEVSYAQRGFWDFFRKENATSLVGVPYTYELLKRLRFFKMELPSLRYMTQAGGKLLPELHKEFAEYAKNTGRRFYVMYGQTEATARMSYLPYQKSLDKYGSMGIAIPGGRFYLIDVDGSCITEANVTGELVYEGPNVTLGYAQCIGDLAKGDERKGRLVTGDMAQRDEDGYYYIVGRKKRFLKIYGNRVNLDECERIIQGHFKDTECACVGTDDHMVVYITDESLADMVKELLAEKTKLNGKAFEVRYIDVIPKNDSGKKIYKELEKLC